MNLHKLQIASAVQKNGGHSNINLDSTTLTTAKMGQILPIFHRECVPGDKFRVHVGTFSRFLPMPVPSYVNLTYRTMSVFVPYHQVMDGAESFFANQSYFKGKLNHLPMVSVANICNAFINYPALTTGEDTANIPEDERWKYYRVSGGSGVGTSTIWLQTPMGNYIDKVLHLLGYRFPRRADVTWKFNALPLLAFAHAYNCYLSYSAHYNTSALSQVLETLKRNPADLSVAQLRTIFTSILLTYEESFFSSAWARAYSSSNNISTAAYGQTSIGNGDTVAGTSDKVVDWNPNDSSLVDTADDTLTSAQVRLLLRFDDYFRRCNFAGSKDIEQIYSRFGVKIDDYKTRYPYFLGESGQRVQIGDVTSTSDTELDGIKSPVGSYAGKAILSDDAQFTFDAKDYGMLFTFAWYAPKPIFASGIDKELLRVLPLDFYTPEFDEGFAAAVPMMQLNAGDKQNGLPSGTFGYVPVYSEYLYGQDYITGDFERFLGFDAWHFGRDVTGNPAAQSDSLIYIPSGGTEFERIFMVTDPSLVDADSIYMVSNIECSAIRPMKNYTGKSDLGAGSIDLPALGSQMN